MCGRFVASRPVEDIARLLDVDEVDVPPELAVPRWNIAPQAEVLAVTSSRHDPTVRRLSAFRWGLVPWWAKDPAMGARAFNAKVETVEEKAMFRGAVAHQRCVIPADAFYEWAPAEAGDRRRRKQPWCYRSADSGLLLLGGLWERWRPKAEKGAGEPSPAGAGEPSRAGAPSPVEGGQASEAAELATTLRSCTILTMEANELVGRVHNRMPVLIAERDLEAWLSPEPLAAGELNSLIHPVPAGVLEAFRVSTAVNDAREEGPELVEPIAEDDSGQAQLF
jgi:putative SOS response-associated peptidase YedK